MERITASLRAIYQLKKQFPLITQLLVKCHLNLKCFLMCLLLWNARVQKTPIPGSHVLRPLGDLGTPSLSHQGLPRSADPQGASRRISGHRTLQGGTLIALPSAGSRTLVLRPGYPVLKCSHLSLRRNPKELTAARTINWTRSQVILNSPRSIAVSSDKGAIRQSYLPAIK